MENHHLLWEKSIERAIFNSYVINDQRVMMLIYHGDFHGHYVTCRMVMVIHHGI